MVAAEPDDVVLVYVDRQLVLDNWSFPQPYPQVSSPIRLQRGRRHDLLVYYLEQLNNASFQLYWSSLSQTPVFGLGPIPSDHLYAIFEP